MTSEWMKVMLEEIARKKIEAEQVRTDERAALDDERGRMTPQVVLESDTCGQENKIGYAEQPRDSSRGRTRP